VEVATQFLPIYPLDADNDDSPPGLLPFFASAPLTKAYPNVTTLVVMVHDWDREAARAFAFANAAQDAASTAALAGVGTTGHAEGGFIFAPQFLEATDASDNPALLRWNNQGWAEGKESINQKNPVSTFAVLDYVLLSLARPKFFPALQRVVLAGSGAGGDLVQRYAVLGIAPDVLANDGIETRFAIANANSFLYLDKNRLGITDPKTDSTEPLPPLAPPPTLERCALFNRFPYGLDDLPAYGKQQGETALRLRYPSRAVYLLTAADAAAAPPATDPRPDGCAQSLQGSTLAARAAAYFANITTLYGSEATHSQHYYPLESGSDGLLSLWRSPCGSAVLWGDGRCKEKGDGVLAP